MKKQTNLKNYLSSDEIALKNVKNLLEASKDIIFILDTQQRHVYVAGLWLEENNLKKSDFLGKDSAAIMGKDGSQVHQEANEKALTGEHVTYDWSMPTAEGTKYFRTSLSPIYGKNDKIIGIAGIGLEITVEKEFVLALEQAHEELKQRNEDLQTFISVASHDLKQPLHTIMGYLGLIKAESQANVPQKILNYITKTQEIVNRQAAYIDDLLYYSKVGLSSPNFEPTDLNQVVKQAIANLGGEIKELKANIVVHDLPTLSINEKMMVQVYQNLISNALKFKRPNSNPLVELGVKHTELHQDNPNLTRDKPQRVLYVKDNGIGIDPSYNSDVFALFTRLTTKHTNDIPGTGAGLALTKKIIEIHSGTIWYTLNEDQPGTTFLFTINDKKIE